MSGPAPDVTVIRCRFCGSTSYDDRDGQRRCAVPDCRSGDFQAGLATLTGRDALVYEVGRTLAEVQRIDTWTVLLRCKSDTKHPDFLAARAARFDANRRHADALAALSSFDAAANTNQETPDLYQRNAAALNRLADAAGEGEKDG